MILFILFVLITTSSWRGTEPPTKPVFPPYGTTANNFSLQYFRHFEIYSVDVGLSTIEPIPENLRVMSITNGLISSLSTITFSVPITSLKNFKS
jgi:hypothetical protein